MRLNIRRFIIPGYIMLLRALFAIVIYYLPGKAAEPWNVYAAKMPYDWLYLFTAWDSRAYHSLAANWYPAVMDPHWAFWPLYPASIRLLGLLGLDLWLGGFVIAELGGLLSILVFLRIASAYLSNVQSFAATALYFTLPPVFIFTAVSYTESLFLLFTLMAWYTHIKGRETSAAVFASFAALTRVYGLLIVVPLAYDFLHSRQFRKSALLAIPISSFVGWLSYAYFRTGDALAPLTAESYWNTPVAIQLRESIDRFFLSGDLRVFGYMTKFQLLALLGGTFVIVMLWLCTRTWKLDKSLGVYSFTFLLSLVSAAVAFIPAFVSIPRFLSTIFPLGLPLKTTRTRFLVALLCLLAVLDLLAWWMFLFTDIFH